MKKFIFISLLVIPFCRAADTDYYKTAYNAAGHEKWQKLYKLIDEGKVGVNDIRKGHKLFINFPIEKNKLEMTTKLINKEAELNNTEGEGLMPLQMASHRYLLNKDNLPSIKLLLDSGADPSVKSRYGENTFEFVAHFESLFSPNSYYEEKQELFNLFKMYVSMAIKPAK